MKFIFSLLILSSIIQHSFSQYIVLNLQLGNCIRCYKNVAELNECITKYPTFISLDPSNRADSAEIIKTFKVDQFGFDITFDSTIYYRTKHKDFSTFNAFDFNDSLIIQQDILKTNSTICNDLHLDIKLSLQDATINQYVADTQVSFNFMTGITEILVNDTKVKSIYSSILSKEELYELIPEQHKKLNTPEAFEKILNNPYLVNKVMYASIWKDNFLYLLYNFKIIGEVKAEDTIVRPLDVIIKYNILTEQKSTFLLDQSEKIFIGLGFDIVDDSTIIILTTKPDEYIEDLVKNAEPIYNVSQFVLRNGMYHFDKYFPIDLAPIYRQKLLYNQFSLHASNYPLLTIYKDNYVYDLATGKKWNILENNRDANKNTENFSKPYLNEHFFVFGIIKGETPSTFHVLFGIENELFIYTSKMGQPSKTISINSEISRFLGQNNQEITFADCDDDNKRIYLRLTNNKTIVFPSALWKD